MLPYAKQKENVINPMVLLNTVGMEVCDILSQRGIQDYESIVGIQNLSQKETLTNKQIDKVCAILNDTNIRDFILSFQSNYLLEKKKAEQSFKQAKKNYTKLKVVLPLLRNEFTDGVDRLDDILDYFGVMSEEEIFASAEQTASLFREQNNVQVDSLNLKAWLRRGELDFAKKNLPSYDEEKLKEWIEDRKWLQHLEDENYFKALPERLSSLGVALVLVPFLPKTVYGAVTWIEGHPLIQISDRNQDLATCWFTLFHEFGHVILHKDANIYEGSMNDTKSSKVQRERDANKFANKYLFNGDVLRKDVFDMIRKGEYIVPTDLSKKYNVNLIFVAYWLRKAQYQPNFQKKIHIDFTSLYQ